MKHMGQTLIEKIISRHCKNPVHPGDIVNITVDTRAARDFGGANVIQNLETHGLSIDDPTKTFFTFDCNPGGSDQKYAANQQKCRLFARARGITVFDITQGIGTHIAIDQGLIQPGGTFVSTDSHANILGAIGAFGQGMGDRDIAHAFARGSVWFKVPRSLQIYLKGTPSPMATAKDVTLAMLRVLGANGLLGYAAEVTGPYCDTLDLSGRITIASMATEMGAITLLFSPTSQILEELSGTAIKKDEIQADPDAQYDKKITIDITGIPPLLSRPGHPEDVTEVASVKGIKIDSGFIGSCTNGRYTDLENAAKILKGKKIAPGVVLKIVPSTRHIWNQCLKQGLIKIFLDAGALVGNPGCAGCAAGQIGQNGPGEVTISSGNRNYTGKQGKGEVYLASPATVAASALAGYITSSDQIPITPTGFLQKSTLKLKKRKDVSLGESCCKKPVFTGRAWVIPRDNIDTDMIYHNQYLSITQRDKMGEYTFGNLSGWEDFSTLAHPGDIIITGKNFGCGSSRQQAVDCFKSLGISLIIAESFGAIYERNAINAAFPIMTYTPPIKEIVQKGDVIRVDCLTGEITHQKTGETLQGNPFSAIQYQIYIRGGLLEPECTLKKKKKEEKGI
jgi:homoaconitate hydratase family protein/3-isopropylmalate dehydratase small subunit